MSACEAALTRAKNLHIDECEAIFVQKKIFTVRITDSEIAEIKQNQDRNLGIRVINQKKISSAQTNNPDKYSRIIEQALQSSKFLKPIKYWKSLPSEFKGSAEIKNLFDKKLEEISTSTASDIAQSMINAAGHPKISSISGSLNIVAENVEISNSNGLSCSDKATYISGTINSDSEEGISPVSGIGQASCRTLDAFSAESVGTDSAEMCVGSINP
ncbi:MAG: DNA gyrase modulator, partial [Nitrosopumilaceae archaeon]